MNRLLLLVMVALCTNAAAQNADKILGKQFYRADKKAIVTFSRQTDSTYCACTTWLKEPNDKNGNPRTDKNNPQEHMRQRPLLGMKVMYDLTYCQEFGLCECCPKYDEVVELINNRELKKDKSE